MFLLHPQLAFGFFASGDVHAVDYHPGGRWIGADGVPAVAKYRFKFNRNAHFHAAAILYRNVTPDQRGENFPQSAALRVAVSARRRNELFGLRIEIGEAPFKIESKKSVADILHRFSV